LPPIAISSDGTAGDPISHLPGVQAANFAESMASPAASVACDCPDAACNTGPVGPPRTKPGCLEINDMWTDLHAHRRIYVQTDYLSWWAKGNPLPPLVTTSPPGTVQSQAGILPESATTAILFGDQRVDTQTRNGARINVGYWLIDGEFLGIEGQYFALEHTRTSFHADANQFPILARPFLNVNPAPPIFGIPTEDAALIAFDQPLIPSGVTLSGGSVDVRTTSNVQSAGAVFRKLIWVDFTSMRRLDLLAGYRFFRLDDSVTIDDQFTSSGGIVGPPVLTTSQDLFSARNEFHGGDIGLKFQQYCCSRFSAELIGKCAFGNNRELVFINGFTNITPQNQATVTFPGGLLTQPTNIGTFRRDVFAFLPEADATLRIDITHNARLTLGYTFIYLNRVQRSGDAIDRTINPTQIAGGTLVGEARPAFAFHDTTMWIHGATFGFEYRW
jgi:hypothetical protein